jgi:RNase H-fold protein (predicted Holliday junction resolvase)
MSETGEKTVLAIDPGHAKCGLVVAKRNKDGEVDVLWRRVARTESLMESVKEAAAQCHFSMVIVGSGTRSAEVVKLLREWQPSVGILVVDEKDTTLQARERYWVHNPRKGIKRIIPSTLLVPPEDVDDFVALILAERVLVD